MVRDPDRRHAAVKRRFAAASDAGQIKVLRRALAVLAAFDDTQPCLRLSQASRKLGMSKATLLRVLRTLQTHDFVRQRPEDHSFVLGPAAIRLGTLALRHTGVFEIARPYLRRLQATTGETVCLFVVSGTDRLCVESIPSQHDLRMTADVGTTRPLHAGAAGKVLLAFMEEAAARRVLLGRRLPRLTADPRPRRVAGRRRECPRAPGQADDCAGQAPGPAGGGDRGRAVEGARVHPEALNPRERPSMGVR
jgi:DNA-binding IclR family transcriptional regulator